MIRWRGGGGRYRWRRDTIGRGGEEELGVLVPVPQQSSDGGVDDVWVSGGAAGWA